MFALMSGNLIYESLMIYLLGLCAFITAWVFLVLGWQILGWYNLSAAQNENNWVEMAWTFIPVGVVGYLCSLNLVCMAEALPVVVEGTIKAVGRQWYWSYEIVEAGVGRSEYDSVMADFIDSVDKPIRVTVFDFYQLIVTSSDVIHSFALPALHLKVDAIPGRVNYCVFLLDRLGVFVGYCSELCGAGHAYMPIVVECVIPDYKELRWRPYSERGMMLH